MLMDWQAMIAANGIVFNCYFENWNSDAIDWAFRGYRDTLKTMKYYDSTYISRVERCIFDNSYFSKYEGGGSSDSTSIMGGFSRPTIFFTNNIYNNTELDDYHWGYDAYRVNETYYFDDNFFVKPNNPKGPKIANKGFIYGFHDLGESGTYQPNGHTYLFNNLFYDNTNIHWQTLWTYSEESVGGYKDIDYINTNHNSFINNLTTQGFL